MPDPPPEPEPRSGPVFAPDAERVESVQPVLVVSTNGDPVERRICPEPGTYVVRALAAGGIGENAATAMLVADDGVGDDGTFVAVAMRLANGPVGVSSEPVEREAGACYWLASQTGVEGRPARAELLPVRR